jgi:hypothetical protein
MKNKTTFRVVEVSEKESLTGKNKGLVALKGVNSFGTSQIKIMIDPDEVSSFQVGDQYSLTLTEVVTTQPAE